MDIKNLSYTNFIESIVNQKRGLSPEPGYEKHHIIPKFLGGSDSSFNLVKLTCFEHVIAHYLLAKELESIDAYLAFGLLDYTRPSKITKEEFESLTDEDLKALAEMREKGIEANRIRMVENNPMKNPEIKAKAIENCRKTREERGEEIRESFRRSYRKTLEERPELRENSSKRTKRMWEEDPDLKDKLWKGLQEKVLKDNPNFYSDIAHLFWDDPEKKATRCGENHLMKKEENREKARVNTTNLWKDPDYRKNQIESIVNGWTDEKRENQSQITKNYFENHPEAKENTSIRFKNLWQDEEFREKILKNGNNGRRRYTNGTINILVKGEPPEGFYLGTAPRKKRMWYNNGIEEAQFEEKPDDPQWVKGRLNKGSKWYNNGEINIMSKTCPEGFVPGMLPKNFGGINE